MRTGPGGGGRSTSDFVYVSKSRIDPPERLVTRNGRDDSPQLRAAVAAGQGAADRAQVPADGLQLAHDRLRVVLRDRRARAVAQLSEPHERLPLTLPKRHRVTWRGQDGIGQPPRLSEVVRAARERHRLDWDPRPQRELLVGKRSEDVDGNRTDPRKVEMHVVPGQPELLQVRANGLGGKPLVTQRRNRRAGRALRELSSVRPEHEPVVDVFRRLRRERSVERAVERLVRPVVVPADHVRDREVDVVHDARELIGRRPVVAQERYALEPLGQVCRGRAVSLLTLALPDRPLVPFDAEPPQVLEDRLLAAGDVPCGVGVVDPQQHLAPEVPVGDGAERVSDVKRARRARSEADTRHAFECRELVGVPAVVVLVHDGVAAAARDQVPVDRKATTNATTSENASEPQKSASPKPASIAPGIKRMIALSTISITAIESVSAASASGSTVARASPDRSRGTAVSE